MMKYEFRTTKFIQGALIGSSLSILTATAAVAGAMPHGYSDNSGGYNPSSYQSPEAEFATFSAADQPAAGAPAATQAAPAGDPTSAAAKQAAADRAEEERRRKLNVPVSPDPGDPFIPTPEAGGPSYN